LATTSGGRVLLGVGAGWLKEEFDLLGQSFENRGRRMNEAIKILKACWADDPVHFEGEYYRLAPFGMDPKPPQGPRLPVLAGGESDAALRRVAEVCDGWHPLNLSPEQLGERLGRLRDFAAQAGRKFSDLMLTARAGQQVTLTPDLASRYEALGIRILVADVNYRQLTLPEAQRQIERLAKVLRLA
jgi:alkanesulfonate monooxygenase SsuD/methylene tetrahydromethanopterin reductase-like flavin-dependent oxidoreductase (luciferase family)